MPVEILLPIKPDKVKIATPIDPKAFHTVCGMLGLAADDFGCKVYPLEKVVGAQCHFEDTAAGLSVTVRVLGAFGHTYIVSYDFNAGASSQKSLEKFSTFTKTYFGGHGLSTPADYCAALLHGRFQLVEVARDMPWRAGADNLVYMRGTKYGHKCEGSQYIGGGPHSASLIAYDKSVEMASKGLAADFEKTLRLERRLRPVTGLSYANISNGIGANGAIGMHELLSLSNPFKNVRIASAAKMLSKSSSKSITSFVLDAQALGVNKALTLHSKKAGGLWRKQLLGLLEDSKVSWFDPLIWDKKGWAMTITDRLVPNSFKGAFLAAHESTADFLAKWSADADMVPCQL